VLGMGGAGAIKAATSQAATFTCFPFEGQS
jgi:hypothetical protein